MKSAKSSGRSNFTKKTCSLSPYSSHAERLNGQKLQIQIEKLSALLNENSKVKTHIETNNALEKVSGQLNQEIDALQRELQSLRN